MVGLEGWVCRGGFAGVGLEARSGGVGLEGGSGRGWGVWRGRLGGVRLVVVNFHPSTQHP